MPIDAPMSARRLAARLADPALRESLSHFVRARVPPPAVQDVVQATLAEALDAADPPEQDEEVVRWVHGICRNKVVDWFREMRREVVRDPGATDTVPAAEGIPVAAIDLLRWAHSELPEGEEHRKTLEWMLREAEGEKLEAIAAEAKLPAPRVRQRVSRLRRHFQRRWAAQAAALAALLVAVAVMVALALRQKKDVVAPRSSPSFVPPPSPRAPQRLTPERPAVSVEPSPVPPPPAPSAPAPSASSSSRSTPAPARTSSSVPPPPPQKKRASGEVSLPAPSWGVDGSGTRSPMAP
jgi:DNA-directed RNA polymerase specialized sigma24 family protein